MLLEVVQDRRDVDRREDRVRAEHRVHQILDVRLEVGQVVLLWEGRHWAAERGGHVLVDGILLGRLHGRVEQLIRVGDLERLEDALLDLADVVQARDGRRALGHGLDLGVALRLTEDVRVADRHDVEHAVEVVPRGELAASLLLELFVVEVQAVQPIEDAQHARHGVVQALVDGRVDDRALLQLGQRGAHRRVGVAVGDVLEGRAHHALARVDQEAEELEEHRRGWVVGQGHGQLADVVHVQAALDLLDLARLQGQALATSRAALELEHRLAVADVRSVEQGAQCARRSAAQTADHVRQADRVGAAPRDEGELDEPLQLLVAVVVLFPVAINCKYLARRLIDRDDVGHRLLVLDRHRDVGLVDDAQAILVVAGLVAPLDLVVGLRRDGLLRLHARGREVYVAVHARLDALLVVELRQVLHVRLALRRVEVRRGVGQVHLVDADEEGRRPVALLVPAQLEVLRAAQWHLRHELLKLGPELGRLHGHLPVQQLDLALGLLDLLLRRIADDVVLGRAAGGEDLLHRPGGEVHAGLGEHGMHDLRRALELRPARCVLAQTRAAQALLVLLVALLARLLVLADHFQQGRGQAGQLVLGERLGEVGVEVALGVRPLLVECHDRAAVGSVLDAVIGLAGEFDVLALGQLLFVHASVLHAA